jgi:putative transposase
LTQPARVGDTIGRWPKHSEAVKYTDTMQYRRSKTGGGTYFFTINLAQRSQQLLVEHIEPLRVAMAGVKARHPFAIEAVVILPDHLHSIWTLPPGDWDYPTRWMLIKSGFSRQLPKGERVNASRRTKGERGIWQRRYWEHTIRDDQDFRRHVDYVHYNPVKHGYVCRPSDWPYSSIHGYIRDGLLPADWGASLDADDDNIQGQGAEFGEIWQIPNTQSAG